MTTTAGTRTPTILEALDDDDLFGTRFRGPSWAAWRAFLAAVFALPMDGEALEVFQARTGRQTAPTAAFDEVALIAGRRAGKSQIMAIIAVFLAGFRDYTPYLAPGELAVIAVLASQRKQARNIMRFVLGLLEQSPRLSPLIEEKNTESILLKNRVLIDIGTASNSAVRGASYAAVLCDEQSHWQNQETGANEDREVLRSLRPALANIPGSMLIMGSSPYAQKGELYTAYQRYYGRDDAGTLVWVAPTLTMHHNSRLEKMREREMEIDPENARAEWDAEFRQDIADFVTRAAAEAVKIPGRTELPPIPGVSYRAFCDPSGGVKDSMTIAVGHLEGDIGILDAALEIRAPFDPDDAVRQCAELMRRYSVTRVTADRFAAQWPVSRFAAHGCTLEHSQKSRSDIYLDLLPLISSRRIELLDNERLITQLVSLERRSARSGRDSVDHGRNGHDDLINSAAGVLVNLELDRRPAFISVAGLHDEAAPVAVPRAVDFVYAVLHISKTEVAAVVYACFSIASRSNLLILDFDAGPLTGSTMRDITARLTQLGQEIRCRSGCMLFVPSHMRFNTPAANVSLIAIPDYLYSNPVTLAVATSEHVDDGRLKIAAPAAEKSKTHPFGGPLDFKAGDLIEADPLRFAALLASTLTLDDNSRRLRA